MWSIILILSLGIVMILSKCLDGVDNAFIVNSTPNANLLVQVKDVTILVYDHRGRPSCHYGRVNVVLPGYLKFVGGTVTVNKDVDLFKKSVVNLGINMNNQEICHQGYSVMWPLPSSFCNFNLSEFFPENVSRLLQKKGVHTIEELEDVLSFNRSLELPESPTIVGISLIDVFSGNYNFSASLHTIEGKIMELRVPSASRYLQLGKTNQLDFI